MLGESPDRSAPADGFRSRAERSYAGSFPELLTALGLVARSGRFWLAAGLLGGAFLQGPSQALRPWVPELAAFLLLLAAMRIGAPAAVGQIRDAGGAFRAALALQLALPLAALGILSTTGLIRHDMAMVFVLIMSAPPVTAAVNFAIMLGRDSAPALRLLILGTVLAPVAALPAFWALSDQEMPRAAAGASLKLLLVVAVAVALGFAFRRLLPREPAPRLLEALDGLSVIALVAMVIGLMSAVGPALETRPSEVAAWLVFAFAASFGMQAATGLWLSRRAGASGRVAICLAAGNRNVALYLAALPPETVDSLLLFIGCYQAPMFLTPLLMRGFYRRILPEEPAARKNGKGSS